MTLQGGLRYDYLLTSYPESKIGGPGYTAAAQPEIVYPSRSTQGIHWHDVTARWGVAYDVFGNGKTAVKWNMGKYMEAFVASNSDFDLNPLIRSTVSTTRVWTDTNKDFVPNCNLSNAAANAECGAMNDSSLGKEKFTRTYDPGLTTGYGNRPYNWGTGVSVQQEVMPRVSVDVGYFRNWWSNWYAVDNRATEAGDYTPFSIRAPLDPRLPGGGGQVISGLYDLVPGKVGQLDELAQHATNLGAQTENWQGVDVNVSARLRNGLTIRGGTSTGRRLEDACGLKAALPEQGANANGSNTGIAGDSLVDPYCKVVEPYQDPVLGARDVYGPQDRGPAERDVAEQPGGRARSELHCEQRVHRRGPQPLGRGLSNSTSVTVNLIEPETFFAPRRNSIDMRLAKIIRWGRTRTQVGFDIFNVMNNDEVTTYSQTFNPATTTWLNADRDHAGAVHQVQRAVRLLKQTLGSRLQALGFCQGLEPEAQAEKARARSRKRAGLLS